MRTTRTVAKKAEIEYTFKNGVKFGPGRKQATPAKTKESTSSNGVTKYTTILWSDKVLTCDCTGWAIRKFDKVTHEPIARTCKHCKASVAAKYADMVDVGTAAHPVAVPTTERQLRKIAIRPRN